MELVPGTPRIGTAGLDVSRARHIQQT